MFAAARTDCESTIAAVRSGERPSFWRTVAQPVVEFGKQALDLPAAGAHVHPRERREVHRQVQL